MNAFLNTLANDDPNAVSDAATALTFANDEPNQLAALSSDLLPTDSAGLNAVAVLTQVFPMVPAALTTIANSGGDQGVISTQVNLINQVRLVDFLCSSRCQKKKTRKKSTKANVRYTYLDVRLFCRKLGSCLMLLRETMA